MHELATPNLRFYYLKDIKTQFNNCVILGDKGYLSADYQLDLFESKQIKLEVPMRKNQENYSKQSNIFQKEKKADRNLVFATLRPFHDKKKLC